MAELLTYANYAKVGKALNVSRNAVRQWARGKDVTPYRVRQVRDLLRPSTQQDTAPPEWARRLLTGVMALERKDGVTAVRLGLPSTLDHLRNWHRGDGWRTSPP